MPSDRKVLLVGWDAADWKIINPLLDAGYLPNLARMTASGVAGNLATLDPPYSPMLWTSIATGKRPYRHGVLGFTEPTPDGQSVRPVLSVSRRVKALWNILTQEGLRTHVVGWWPSHPAEPINGVMVSNFFQKDTGRRHDPWPVPAGTVHPAEWTDRFAALRVHPEELTGQHLLPFVPDAEKIDQTRDRHLYILARLTAHAASIQAAATHVLRTEPWDFAAVYFDAIDHYCHGFMRYHPPKRPHIPQPVFDLYKGVVTAAYRFHDMMLGRLLDLAGDDATVLLLSDHGFQPDHLRPKYVPREAAGPAYEHSPYGIFCMKGPGIRRNGAVYGGSVLDVTPTVLALFGLPVGEDMDGKVLSAAFDADVAVATIPSWEAVPGACGMPPGAYDLADDARDHLLEQLVALGYVEPPPDDRTMWVRRTEAENQFNLARAYLDGGRLADALPILEKLHAEPAGAPDTRVTMRLAGAYQAAGRLRECRGLVDEIRTDPRFDTPVLDLLEGTLLLGEHRPHEALRLFRRAEDKIDPGTYRIHLKLAQCYFLLGRFAEAERVLRKELELDYDHAAAQQLLGTVCYYDDRFDDAVAALLTAVGLDYELPLAHFYLGLALAALGRYADAAEAFEVCLTMMPDNNRAREQLVVLYQTHLGRPQEAARHRQQIVHHVRGTLTVVSGLPRSGTSMMMRMLERGGMSLFTDTRRSADDNNPLGYYEHEAVKSLRHNKDWLPLAEGKAVKVIAPLLPHLPPSYRYHIVFMERDLSEIVQSQRTMLRRLGKPVRQNVDEQALWERYVTELQQVKHWLSSRSNSKVLYVSYADVLRQPFQEALRIREFLGLPLAPEQMVTAVDRGLYRERKFEWPS